MCIHVKTSVGFAQACPNYYYLTSNAMLSIVRLILSNLLYEKFCQAIYLKLHDKIDQCTVVT